MTFSIGTNCYHGDCLEVMKDFPNQSIDLVLTDLPYGTTACVWDTVIDLDHMWEQFLRIGKETTPFVFTCAQPFTSRLGMSKIDLLRYEWIWEKAQGTNPLNKDVMPLRSHENILVFYRTLPIYNPQLWKGKPYSAFSGTRKTRMKPVAEAAALLGIEGMSAPEDSKIGEVYGELKSQHRDNPTGDRYPKTVIQCPQEKGLHPTQKPVALMEYLIKTYTNPEGWVLDACMGSGTTGVACKRTRRNFVGIELDSEYFRVARDRIAQTAIVNVEALDLLIG